MKFLDLYEDSIKIHCLIPKLLKFQGRWGNIRKIKDYVVSAPLSF